MNGPAIRAGQAFVELVLRGREKVSKDLQRLGTQAKAFARSLTTLPALLGALGAGAIFATAVTEASKLEETVNKFVVVFGEAADSVRQWGEAFAGAVGRSKNDVLAFLASTQDLLVPLGFAADQAQAMSQSIVQLAVDLGSFNNLPTADVVRDIQAAMTGSGEVMKKYGVLVQEAQVKQALLNAGLDPSTATDQQKAMARLNLIIAGTTAAHGDAIRSADSFANQLERAKASIRDTAAELGSNLLPSLSNLLKIFSDVIAVSGIWGNTLAASAKSNSAFTLTSAGVAEGLAQIVLWAQKAHIALAAMNALWLRLRAAAPNSSAEKKILQYQARQAGLEVQRLLSLNEQGQNSLDRGDVRRNIEAELARLEAERQALLNAGGPAAFDLNTAGPAAAAPPLETAATAIEASADALHQAATNARDMLAPLVRPTTARTGSLEAREIQIQNQLLRAQTDILDEIRRGLGTGGLVIEG